MFSNRPRRRPAFPFPGFARRRPQKRSQVAEWMSYFQDDQGNMDYAKIAGGAQQAKDLYAHVKPMVTPYVQKFLK
ncbi:hypothetical protein LZP85_04560 [Priestia flexa]|jgi:tryptophanyl-tRNA synthetase|uniref:Uncharacterized protein n=2 Tax=Priestia TaxID=2800373 RepID=A0A0V8JMA3_9BACI|nr:MULTISPECIES: hypothetical protein [Priestia]AQX55508.1 hypothetical protein BC359_15155 [Priestia flexa]KSU88159.1 hypothetical protein AS180_09560 [Priestia veravalensis]MBN8252631.1 hypothetical protein [Priestia flexa]MBN8434102.1 hypothetical protein [Priestia flexa]MBY6086158.1 hypothetical protein [Priestia flexa]